MDEQAFQNKFTELLGRIKDLPESEQQRLQKLANDTLKRRERLQSSVSELQDSMDHLRLTVKYLVFDLEATRRENAYLRRMLEEANKDRGRDRPDDNEDSF